MMAAEAAANIAAPRSASPPPPPPLLLLSCCTMEEVGHGDSLSKAGGYSPTSAPVHLCTAATGARPGRLPPPPCYYYHYTIESPAGMAAAQRRRHCSTAQRRQSETKQAKQAVAHASSPKKNDFRLKIKRNNSTNFHNQPLIFSSSFFAGHKCCQNLRSTFYLLVKHSNVGQY